MRWSESLIPTLRDVPKDAEAISHQLMLRAGLVRKLSSGIYNYLPLGFLALKKVEAIVREEMLSAGAIEVLLPALHPAELWKKTGRYQALGADKISFKTRGEQEFVLGPTHEEVITDLVASNVKSYRELPLILFQIQTKFRDEIRPRFGVIRSKEFIMKDAYSFDCDWEGLDRSYQKMLEAYKRIFTRCGLKFEIVNADPGIMGGNVSHEFMLLADFGEDLVASCDRCELRSTPELVACLEEKKKPSLSTQKLEIFDTPNLKTIEDLTSHFKIKGHQLLKTLLYLTDGKPLACLVRGDTELSESKLKKFLKAETLMLASEHQIEAWTGAPLGFSGPMGLKKVRIVADELVGSMSDFVTGANQKDKHYRGVNLGRDIEISEFGDFRVIRDGEPCSACGKGTIRMKRAMEIGHIFKLGTRYSKPLEAHFLDESGKRREIIMGCYGIGVSRLVSGAIEQNHDDKGIIWPETIAPFQFHLLTLNHSEPVLQKLADEIYEKLNKENMSVLYDDRNERAGVKFNDADLIGIPYQIVLGEQNAKQGKVELKKRRTGEKWTLAQEELFGKIRELAV